MTQLLIVLTLPESVRNLYRDRIGEAFPELTVRLADSAAMGAALAAEADILLGFGVMLTDEIFARGSNLRWVQALGSGVDGIVDQASFRSDILVTNMQGLHGPPCAEAALCAMLDLARQTPRVLANQRQRRWERFPVQLLDGKHVVIIGMGVIASALGPRCRAMGMRVTGVSGAPRDVDGFDEVLTRGRMLEAVADADYVILLTPYTKENHHLVDAAFLAAMKPSARLVNIARGGVIDEAALVAALRSGSIAGAALDVFAHEPLPEDSPLWSLDNVVLTPHLGGFHDEYPQRALPVIERNIRSFLDGDLSSMVNVVHAGAR